MIELGGAAAVEELVDAVRAELAPAQPAAGPEPARLAAGLLWLALDRGIDVLEDVAPVPVVSRRRAGRTALIASESSLLDGAQAPAGQADDLVVAARSAGDAVVPRTRVLPRLREVWARAVGDEAAQVADARLIRLATVLARHAVRSGADDLYDRDLDGTSALSHA